MSAFKKEIRDDVSGYVLHARPYQERSLLLTLLTLECGRVSAVMRLSAKSAARSRAELRPFCPLFFSLVQGRSDLLVLRSARPSGAGLKFPVPAVFCAEYLNELLYCLYKDREPSPELFASYIRALGALASGENAERPLREFELALLSSLGYAPDFARADGREWEDSEAFVFISEIGIAPAQGYEDPRDLISGRALNALCQGDRVSPQALRALKLINRRIIAALLHGRRLHSRDLYGGYLKESSDGQFL
ncbi:MAG: DNA repair protein RecO [Succinivibrio sp.]|nr:DNA repair protein RecO [Succinivibrio sp.]